MSRHRILIESPEEAHSALHGRVSIGKGGIVVSPKRSFEKCTESKSFLSDSAGKDSSCNAGDIGDMGLIPGSERSLEEEMAAHSSILAWRIHGQRSLVDYSPWACKESDMTEQLSVCTRACTHAHTWVCTHACTHTCMHTHTESNTASCT